jgi:hypothetical protein
VAIQKRVEGLHRGRDEDKLYAYDYQKGSWYLTLAQRLALPNLQDSLHLLCDLIAAKSTGVMTDNLGAYA